MGMLILTRRVGETTLIGEGGVIKVTVLGIKGNQVRVGIDAPKDMPVHREEIYERIQAEKREAQDPARPASRSARTPQSPERV